VCAKFDRYVGSLLDPSRMQAITGLVANLENVDDASELARLIAA